MDFDVDPLALEISQQLPGDPLSLAELTERLLIGELSKAEQVALGNRFLEVLGGADFKEIFDIKKPKHRPRVGYGKFLSSREDLAIAFERIRRTRVATGWGNDCKMQAYYDLSEIVGLGDKRVREIINDPSLSQDPLTESTSELDVRMILETLTDADLLRYRLPDEFDSAIAGLVGDLSGNG